MNKHKKAEIYFIAALVVTCICIYTLTTILWQRGPNYGATGTQKLGQTEKGQSKGQTEAVFKEGKEVKGGRSSGRGRTIKTAGPGLQQELKFEGREQTAEKGKGTLQKSLESGKEVNKGGSKESRHLAPGSNSAPVSDVNINDNRAFMGLFKITAYTAGPESTGKRPGDPAYGITASGAKVRPEHTIAADWDVLPPGTKVYIEGVGERTVTDKGGAVKEKHIDLYIPELEDALNWGVRHREVWIIKKGAN